MANGEMGPGANDVEESEISLSRFSMVDDDCEDRDVEWPFLASVRDTSSKDAGGADSRKQNRLLRAALCWPSFRRSSFFWASCVSLLFLVTISSYSILRFSTRTAKPQLHFFRDPTDNTSSFRILQVADIHLGENSWTDWGPEDDQKTFRALDSIISVERPDLIVLSGDQITANNIVWNATAYYQLLARRLEVHGIPWALVFGNHDDAPYETEDDNGTIHYHDAKTSRRQLLAVDQRHSLSLTEAGPKHLSGTSNYWLTIQNPSLSRIAARVVLLDSGGGSMRAQVEQNQIDWFRTHNRRHMDNVPVVAFQHIPTSLEDFEFDPKTCRGFTEDGVGGLVHDAGVAAALAEAGNVLFLAVGHNHGNDYCCRHANTTLRLCFGRHSGYGGYGHWDRGARVYQLLLDADGRFAGWASYVRMENGEVRDLYSPTS